MWLFSLAYLTCVIPWPNQVTTLRVGQPSIHSMNDQSFDGPLLLSSRKGVIIISSTSSSQFNITIIYGCAGCIQRFIPRFQLIILWILWNAAILWYTVLLSSPSRDPRVWSYWISEYCHVPTQEWCSSGRLLFLCFGYIISPPCLMTLPPSMSRSLWKGRSTACQV